MNPQTLKTSLTETLAQSLGAYAEILVDDIYCDLGIGDDHAGISVNLAHKMVREFSKAIPADADHRAEICNRIYDLLKTKSPA